MGQRPSPFFSGLGWAGSGPAPPNPEIFGSSPAHADPYLKPSSVKFVLTELLYWQSPDLEFTEKKGGSLQLQGTETRSRFIVVASRRFLMLGNKIKL